MEKKKKKKKKKIDLVFFEKAGTLKWDQVDIF